MYCLSPEKGPQGRAFHIMAVLAMALFLAACEAPGLVGPDAQQGPEGLVQSDDAQARNPSSINRQLAAARAGTARFHDLKVAEAAGFAPASPCIEDEDEGGMGYHYANPLNTALDPANPQLLLYEPRANGRLRLVAVEYLVPYGVMPEDGPAPRLFEQDFHPTPHLEAWTLHVWLWRSNPSGMFAAYNPRVSCQHAE
jgi:hypothetical protein